MATWREHALWTASASGRASQARHDEVYRWLLGCLSLPDATVRALARTWQIDEECIRQALVREWVASEAEEIVILYALECSIGAPIGIAGFYLEPIITTDDPLARDLDRIARIERWRLTAPYGAILLPCRNHRGQIVRLEYIRSPYDRPHVCTSRERAGGAPAYSIGYLV